MLTRREIVVAVAAPALALFCSRSSAMGQPKIEWVEKDLRLCGDWSNAKITDCVAFGNGVAGRDAWASKPILQGAARCRHSTVPRYDQSAGFSYIQLWLELTPMTDSYEVSAIFRYRRSNRFGVFSSSFPFPYTPPVTSAEHRQNYPGSIDHDSQDRGPTNHHSEDPTAVIAVA